MLWSKMCCSCLFPTDVRTLSKGICNWMSSHLKTTVKSYMMKKNSRFRRLSLKTNNGCFPFGSFNFGKNLIICFFLVLQYKIQGENTRIVLKAIDFAKTTTETQIRMNELELLRFSRILCS